MSEYQKGDRSERQTNDNWDSLLGYEQESVDALGKYAVDSFGQAIQEEVTDLTEPMKRADGHTVVYKGRAFLSPLTMPIRRSSGEIEQGWVALGLDQQEAVDEASGLVSKVPYLVVVGSDLEGRRMAKRIPAELQLGLLEELRLSSDVDYEESYRSPEDMLEGFSDQDRQALSRFSFHAANKRDAQLRGYGEESLAHTSLMGDALREMSPEAQSIARDYATRVWGDDQVAF
ncbi:hypothetical protein B7Y94_06120 [Candidatus Saccharibacteria bacterium 32-49-12]|nr:MAG: hypothetical protein B7Y94_06120 [Candidatus Saccharibacteria bacterium 32-49-12]